MGKNQLAVAPRLRYSMKSACIDLQRIFMAAPHELRTAILPQRLPRRRNAACAVTFVYLKKSIDAAPMA
jgi:hypothetical protein